MLSYYYSRVTSLMLDHSEWLHCLCRVYCLLFMHAAYISILLLNRFAIFVKLYLLCHLYLVLVLYLMVALLHLLYYITSNISVHLLDLLDLLHWACQILSLSRTIFSVTCIRYTVKVESKYTPYIKAHQVYLCLVLLIFLILFLGLL